MTTQRKPKAAPAAKKSFSLISDEKLIQLYTTLLKCRILEERVNLFLSKRSAGGKLHIPSGREAAAAGVVLSLLPDDLVAPSSLDLFPNFIHGVPLASVLRPLFSRASSPASDASCSAHNGYQALLATGAALANKIDKNNKVSVVFQGGDASLDSWSQALQFAGLHRLPILFVSCIQMKPAFLPESGPSESPGHTFPSIPVDGNDVVAVYRVASEAIAHARKGSGPTLIDCIPYRLSGRNQPGAFSTDDPILNMEKYLARKALFTQGLKTRTISAFSKQLDTALRAAEKASRARRPDTQKPIVLVPTGSGAE